MNKLFYAILIYSFALNAQAPAGAVGDWPFDNNAQDISGNGNHGTVNGAIPARDRFNQPNKAYRFNGVSSKIVVPHNTSIDIGSGIDFTFGIWMKSYSATQTSVILTKHTSGTWNGYNFVANNQSDPGYCTTYDHVYWYVASGAQQDACSDHALLGDTLWHFLVGSYDAANNKSYFYVDNVLQADIGGGSGSVANPADLSFGNDDDTNTGFFNGVLDGARLYKRMLTVGEINALYNEKCVECFTGVQKRAMSAVLVECFPNPAHGDFTIKSNETLPDAEVLIFNQLGDIIAKHNFQGTELHFETALPNGVYFLKVLSRSKIIAIEKLIIQK